MSVCLFLMLGCMADPEKSDKPAIPFEFLELQSGYKVVGEVLREKADSIILDVGFDVLNIPKRLIERRGLPSEVGTVGQTTGGPLSAGPGRRYGDSGFLFSTADLRPAPIMDLVNRFGEAVVLVKTPGGLGSGFIIDDAGHCITNFHVVEGETEITVDIFQRVGNSIAERTVSGVQIVALNPFNDLALLKIPSQADMPFKVVYFGYTDELREGDVAFAIGNPEGLSRSVTQGIISNRNRNVDGQLYIQTTTQINPGNSGGPLFNARGQVIGVTNMKLTFSEGLGFAIPISVVKDFLSNRDAFAYNKDNPNTGYHYIAPPRRQSPRAK